MARLERFELPTPWFVAKYSIQLSYRRVLQVTARPLGASGASSHVINMLQEPCASGTCRCGGGMLTQVHGLAATGNLPRFPGRFHRRPAAIRRQAVEPSRRAR